ncbi:hypothetical protein BNJ_00227 [Kaumoebavirus]|uniref:hypothetical protein n=1 Tax=Kaumoebavirus TaxID=1859492 RepID=UPI0009C243D0|nr:hypothetical protein BNJ_00227 [Kaumoebavirus]ARA72056.1 hypothetical protein BNJ_00227 [Kaumoebavirus]
MSKMVLKKVDKSWMNYCEHCGGHIDDIIWNFITAECIEDADVPDAARCEGHDEN